jgi:carboxymethylenebutenolidase
MMREHQVTIPTPDGEAPAELFTPDGAGPWPGVVYLTDVWGIRPANRKMARRVAEQGYTVLMPHLFYRSQPLSFDPLLQGRERSPELSQPLVASMSAQNMVRDGGAYVDFLAARPEVSAGGASARAGATEKKIAVVGYCFSGAMAVRIAAARPDKVVAMASFHGGRLVTDKPDSPHLLAANLKAEVYFGHAVQDKSATPEQIATLEAALKQGGGRYQSETYEGALHGWTVEGRPEIYNPAQSERHFEKLFDLLKRTLG